MRINISHFPSILYIRSHLFKSTNSAVKLAEKNSSERDIAFADKLLSVKKSLSEIKLNRLKKYKGEKIKKSEKYAALAGRIENLKRSHQAQGGLAVVDSPLLNRPGSSQVTHALADDISSSSARNASQYIERKQEVKAPAKSPFEELNEITAQRFPLSNWSNVETERFHNIQTALKTQIVTSDGKGMAANQLWVDGKEIAMRSQYPKPAHIEAHLRMLLEKKPAVLVVLSSVAEIKNGSLPPYFCKNGQYGNTSVICQIKKAQHITRLDDLELHNYRINIDNEKEKYAISVIHVTNWEDLATIKSDTLRKLVSTINQKIAEKSQQNSACCAQAFIHCRAGVGRTGLLTAAMQLLKPTNELSAREIVLDLRESGCRQMVQLETQYHTLLELEAQQKALSHSVLRA